MKLPRGKIKINSLTVCGTVQEGRIEILRKIPRGEIKKNSLTVCGTRRKNRDSL